MNSERKALSNNELMSAEAEKEGKHGNTLAIVGSPGSGKTTLAVKLAAEIARRKKNVIVVCSDPFVPSVPFLLPMDTEQETSLGALLTAPSMNQEKILKACVPVPESEYVSLLGYRMGENLMSYPKVTRERAVEFLVCMRHLADYVILDCTSVFEADVFSILAMEMADRVLRLCTADLRGISYYQSHAGLLGEDTENSKYVSAIGNLKNRQEWEAAAGQYGGASYVFPYVAELEKQYDEAHLLNTLTSKEAGPFQTEVRKALTDIFGLCETRQGGSKPGAEKRKLVVRSPFVWKNKGEF